MTIPAQRRILEETIKRLGYDTKTAQGGEQALQILEGVREGRHRPGPARPRHAGHGRHGGAAPHCAPSPASPPVIVQTAHGSIDAAITAMRAGAVDFVVKPTSPERLEVSIKSALKIEALQGEICPHQEEGGGHADLLRPHPPRRGHAARDRARPPRRRLQHSRPDRGRERRRQGADRARHPGRERAQGASPSSSSTAAPSPRTWSRASCSATRRARSPAPSRSASASSRRPTAARCSSTRSASCRSTPRSSCCARCRKARSIPSAPRGR